MLLRPGYNGFRVIVYGALFEVWDAALVDRDVWEGVPGVIEVLRVAYLWAERRSAERGFCTVIIPLGEEHYGEAPRSYLSLVPDACAIATLSNKVSFAAYLDTHGLSKLRPTNYGSDKDVEFPFVLKRTDLAGGMGIEFGPLEGRFRQAARDDNVPGQAEAAAGVRCGLDQFRHPCVCKNGVMLWNCTFAWDLGPRSSAFLSSAQRSLFRRHARCCRTCRGSRAPPLFGPVLRELQTLAQW